MMEFWERAFREKQEMWGMEPAKSALLAKELFKEKSIGSILIPGIGYGRNARPFVEIGKKVTGIEISKTAMELAQKHFGDDLTIHHGSIMDMPFDNEHYGGIFCHALIHLLDTEERKNLIKACYDQLLPNGYMVFTAITKEALGFGKGNHIGKDRYEIHKGAKIFHYDKNEVKAEFEAFGLFEIVEVHENQPMYLIKCKKE